MKRKIICVVGTRPEAIKMAPVILALQKEPWVNVRVLSTAQHGHMLDQVNEFFGIEPDIDLNIMQTNQALTTLTAGTFAFFVHRAFTFRVAQVTGARHQAIRFFFSARTEYTTRFCSLCFATHFGKRPNHC